MNLSIEKGGAHLSHIVVEGIYLARCILLSSSDFRGRLISTPFTTVRYSEGDLRL